MKLTIIIVNYNVRYFLEQALYAVRKAAINIEHEVFVVDNNSHDGSVEMLKEKFPEVKLIANTDNVGFSKANNQAIRLANAEYILLLNPDTVVQEDTFDKVVKFMDKTPDAGGLGVKMLDGKGNFLPESKRGFPSPFVAFFKIFGLSALFPKSKLFGRYHLGFLSPDLIHEVDVLAGAFMLLRKKVLDEIGLLDEDFFMYGEDIDLSYRIKKAGYKNYFYPDTKIIHYKGESTKKGSLNYVFVFYNAMIIFAQKHLSKNNALLFSILIKSAIYIRAFAAIVARIINKLALPSLDSGLLFGGMFLLKEYWEQNHKYGLDYYSPQFMGVVVPIYVSIWLLCMFLSGGYDRPIRLSRIIRGLVFGTIVIVIIYAFLDENWRFSRALIILGAGWSVLATILLRLLLSLLNFKKFKIEGITTEKRVVLVSELEDGIRLKQFITQIQPDINFIGFIHPAKIFSNKNEDYLGTILELKELVEVYQINEVIFSTKNIALQDIIDSMSKIDHAEVDYKIAPEESFFIIGSNSVDDPGDLYTIDINLSIIKPISRRNKRVFDVLSSIMMLLFSPIIAVFQKHPIQFFRNVFLVLFGYKSWVGYARSNGFIKNLPTIKRGILNPVDTVNITVNDENTIKRLNMLYAKHYHPENDMRIVLRNWRKLDRKN